MTDTDTRPAFAGAARAASYVEVSEVPDFAKITPPTPEPDSGTVSETIPETEVEAQPVPRIEDVDLGALAIPQDAPVARRGLRGALGKVGIRLAPGTAEQQALQVAAQLRADETVIRQATWTRAVSILVANRKGGVGKTPTALLLGGILAHIRGGSVAIIEVSDDPGALAFRAEGRPQRGIGELVRDAATITSAGQLAGYTAPQTSFASVIGSPARRERLDRDAVLAATQVLDQYYGIRVMDSGNQPTSSAFLGALETTDALVVPVLNAGDAVLEAVALLEELRESGYGHLADSATILRLTDGRPENPAVVEHATRLIENAHPGAIYDIPYDPHIAERGQLTLSRLGPATYQAFATAGAEIIRGIRAI